MSRSVFIAAAEGESGKSGVAVGVVDLLARRVERIGIFRPLVRSRNDTDELLELLVNLPAVDTATTESAIGVDYTQLHDDPDSAMAEIVASHADLTAKVDVVVVLGSDYTDVASGHESSINASVAANLGCPVVLVVPGHGRLPQQVGVAAELGVSQMRAGHASVSAVVANRVRVDDVDAVRAELERTLDIPVGVLPDMPILGAPTVQALADACDATLLRGNPEWLKRESLGLVVAAMSMPNVLTRLTEDATIIAPGDRYDLLAGLVLAHQSATTPHLSAIILTGGYEPPDSVMRVLEGTPSDLPLLLTTRDTFDTTTALSHVQGRITADSRVKIETALRVFSESVDTDKFLDVLDVAASEAVTPLMFGHRLLERARSSRQHIVLPEGDDTRILQAAASLLRLGVADLTLLGDETLVRAQASAAGVDIADAKVQSPTDPELVEQFAQEYTRKRAHKGMTIERARDTVTDVTYFGTLMVHLGLADGMVSGAAHTTAETIRPAFEIIGTAPGNSVVSSVFLMCLADRVLFYGDCAINPDPTAEQLADIATASAATARQFGTEPRVAMLSYSTGTSGSGADVDKVRQATDIVKEKTPNLLVEGPIQYDAAVDPTVAKSKMPDSTVAGRATVLVFPDLNTGNNTYKAVQRSAGAVAIGPVLQGLNRPVNDLSRGALVDDIINTVAITAIQAQQQ
jgi:phosphate acetyltransferase